MCVCVCVCVSVCLSVCLCVPSQHAQNATQGQFFK